MEAQERLLADYAHEAIEIFREVAPTVRDTTDPETRRRLAGMLYATAALLHDEQRDDEALEVVEEFAALFAQDGDEMIAALAGETEALRAEITGG